MIPSTPQPEQPLLAFLRQANANALAAGQAAFAAEQERRSTPLVGLPADWYCGLRIADGGLKGTGLLVVLIAWVATRGIQARATRGTQHHSRYQQRCTARRQPGHAARPP